MPNTISKFPNHQIFKFQTKNLADQRLRPARNKE